MIHRHIGQSTVHSRVIHETLNVRHVPTPKIIGMLVQEVLPQLQLRLAALNRDADVEPSFFLPLLATSSGSSADAAEMRIRHMANFQRGALAARGAVAAEVRLGPLLG